MMHTSLYVNSTLIGMLIDYLDTQNVAAPLFRQKLAEYQKLDRIAISDWISWLDEIALLTPIPAVGLLIGQQIKAAHTGIVGYLGLSCSSIGELIAVFERFARLIYDVNSLSITLESQHSNQDEKSLVSISWGSEHTAPGQLADETAISAFATMIQTISSAAIYPTKVNFINPAPIDKSPYEHFFHCPVSFGGIRTIVEFPAEYLNIALQNRDAHLLHILEGHAQSLLSTLPSDQFETQLKALLSDIIENQEDPSLAHIAQRMNTSARTLQRKLNQHDIKFQELLASVKLDLFKQYIKNEKLPLFEIALRLGYSEQSAFTRAVKRWTGEVPKSFRK